MPKSSGARFYSPLVLNIAANEGISLAELEKIPGSGNEGRVTKKDVLQWIAARKEQPATATPSIAAAGTAVPAKAAEAAPALSVPASSSPEEEATPEYTGNVEIVEMDRMRKMIAKHMVESRHTSAHVTSFTECDVTGMVQWREKIKAEFEKREGEKITFMPLFIEAIIKCIKKFPWVNSSVDGDKIIIRKDINIGMAAALPNGNLIVPVIKDADLADALNNNVIAGAGIDVLSVEPPPVDNPLFKAKNCIITPHIAWATKEARSRLMDIAVNNLSAFINGSPVNVVNK